MFRSSPAVAARMAAAVFTFALVGAGHSAGGSEIDVPRLFGALDANRDGAVTSDEVGSEYRRLFARLLRTSDANSDGKLDAEEFAAGLTPVRAEKDMVAKQGSRLPGGDALVVLVALMDANGNRQLVADEIPQRFRAVFDVFIQQADGDKNGRLDAREIGDKGPQLGLVAQAAAMRLGVDVQGELAKLSPDQVESMEKMGALPRLEDLAGNPEQARAVFARLDANGDAMLTPDEAPDGLAQLLKRADRDGDGQLSAAEFQAAVKRMAGADGGAPADPAARRRNVQQLLNRFDRNGNGRIGPKEAPPRIANNFDRLDQNRDGQLDAEELEQAAAARGNVGSPPAMNEKEPK